MLYGGWFSYYYYYYGHRLEDMCLEARSKTPQELENLVEEYGFKWSEHSYPHADKDNEWRILIKPSLLANCTIYHDNKTVISTKVFWD